MKNEDQNYYRARAEQELTAASRASDATTREVHEQLAQRYKRLAADHAEPASPL